MAYYEEVRIGASGGAPLLGCVWSREGESLVVVVVVREVKGREGEVEVECCG